MYKIWAKFRFRSSEVCPSLHRLFMKLANDDRHFVQVIFYIGFTQIGQDMDYFSYTHAHTAHENVPHAVRTDVHTHTRAL
jgi:hypothetical protein